MTPKRRKFKYAIDKRPLRETPEADAAAAATFGRPPHKNFRYPLEKRPVRFSPDAAEAAAKAFGDVRYTVGNPPPPPKKSD